MSPSPQTSNAAREYNMGFIWALAAFLLLLVIMSWYAGSLVPVETRKLVIFLGWLHVVPVGALYLHRTLS